MKSLLKQLQETIDCRDNRYISNSIFFEFLLLRLHDTIANFANKILEFSILMIPIVPIVLTLDLHP